ncbi:helix-turn-helix domain-containing protein [Lacrimispora defluvii]|uniref:Helix-turn-helix transcriptional regulator n=1 Tax=Lacrimispora defluvii TaxID=2719233 RepID=A0ABX1VKU2_9FIRM|nr:helix-turn-helix transcriptional regulator [Lacrimispora defluvii]NNJ28948.1 helix-turn-helix transcriptional regulator [Lacrimispora defluvii]
MYEIFELLLKKYGITIYQFCKETGISQSTIYTWKKKRSQVGSEIGKKICDYFKISMDYLITGKEADITDAPDIKSISQKDLAKKIDEIIGEMNDPDTSPLYFNGEKIDDKSLAVLALALENAMKQVEIMREKKKK